MKNFFNNRLIVQTGDITIMDVDAIVNAANSSLMGGGGVDGAIHWQGGKSILEECKEIRKNVWVNGLPAGKAVITTGGKLKARYVIHTVGPVWHGGGKDEDKLLVDAYRNSIALAEEKGLASIAFPAISTGVYGFPKERAAQIVTSLLKDYFSKAPLLQEIRLVFFSENDAEVFEKVINDD